MLRPLQGLAYGALGLPLAFVALPLYVLLPAHYGATLGVPLAALGALLLGARLFDAVVDPWIGRWIDRCHARGRHVVLRVTAAACAVLAAGFVALFFPPVQGTAALLAWCGAMLALTYLAYSALSVVHQSWGARLGGDEAQRAGVVSWREGCALAGVMVASVLPALAGFGATAAVLAVALVLGVTALARWAPAADRPVAHGSAASPWLPLQTPAFRRLLAIHVVNGVASAIPATLVLFFVRDRLQAASLEPLFLAAYFAAGALSMPLWVRVIARLGLARSWLAGMLLSVASFVWAASLGPGDAAAFAAVCIASGLALGADLAVPQAWLAGIVQRAGHQGQHEGSYFGWWNFATKLELALAAGLALPLLERAGYTPGRADPEGLQALALAYAALPCVLKLLAAVLLAASALPRAHPALPEQTAESPT